jgi:hypothetical protein
VRSILFLGRLPLARTRPVFVEVGLKTLVSRDCEVAAADDLAVERRVIHYGAANHRRRSAGRGAEGAQPVDKRRPDFWLGGVWVSRHGKTYPG